MTGLQACLFSLTRKGSLYKYGALFASYELPGQIMINDLAKGVRPDYVVLLVADHVHSYHTTPNNQDAHLKRSWSLEILQSHSIEAI
jgi:hypothetical protein